MTERESNVILDIIAEFLIKRSPEFGKIQNVVLRTLLFKCNELIAYCQKN